MALESGTYINSLNASNPAATDGISQADDHMRLIKSTVKASFPNVAGAANPSHTEMNYLVGVTSALQTQIDAIPKLVKTVDANGGARFPNVGATENLDHRVGGVSRLPKFLVAYAVAASGNNGYTQQDRVLIGGSDTQYNAQSGITVGFDLVNITYRIGTNAAGFTLMSKTNGNSINIANDPNWLLKFDVYA